MAKENKKEELENIDTLKYEKELTLSGYKYICGADEAGRGPLAGPVYAAAVILDPNNPIEGLNDSKKISEKKREKLFDEIIEKALSWSIAFVDEKEIDEINILEASMLAMKKSIESLEVKADYALIDGNKTPDLSIDSEAVIKGDALCQSISAASILAKVARDKYMLKLDEEYPMYNFKKHKGYPTKEHYIAILKNGISPCHRKTFLKNLDEKRKKYAEEIK